MPNSETQYIVQPVEDDSPCCLLEGKSLTTEAGNTWQVISKVAKTHNSSGGRFSVGYIVRNQKGDEAFLKATDTFKLFGERDPAKALNRATAEFLFEKDILDLCRGSKLSRVVLSKDNGTLKVTHNGDNTLVFYLIFELAKGDTRSIIAQDSGYDFYWSLYAIRNLTLAVRQLHGKKIAHNDIKPSNVLLFEEVVQKLGDLGRSVHQDIQGPFDNFIYSGDKSYAAPELLYRLHNESGRVPKGSLDARKASDLYLLGSMIYFFVTATPLTATILSTISTEQIPVVWTGSFEEVLPYWKDAFGKTMLEFEKQLPRTPFDNPEPVGLELANIVRWLCEPDPSHRGHPVTVKSGSDIYSVERLISLLDKLILKYEVTHRKH